MKMRKKRDLLVVETEICRGVGKISKGENFKALVAKLPNTVVILPRV